MQQDYILRLIERIGLLFAAIRRLILGRVEPGRVETELRSAASASGFDLDLIRELDLDSLLAVVAPGSEVDVARVWLLAELLMLDGLQDSALGEKDRARSRLLRSRALFELLGTSGSVIREFPEAVGRIDEIDTELDALGRE